MSTSLQAHSTIMGVVRQANPQEDVRRQRVFAWGVTAMLMLCTPLLSQWLTVVEGRAKAQSKLRRLYRWVCTRPNRNSQVGPEDVLRGITRPTP